MVLASSLHPRTRLCFAAQRIEHALFGGLDFIRLNREGSPIKDRAVSVGSDRDNLDLWVILQNRPAEIGQPVVAVERYDQEIWMSLSNRVSDPGFLLDLTDDFDVRLIGNGGHHEFAHETWAVCNQHSDGCHGISPAERKYPGRASAALDSNWC